MERVLIPLLIGIAAGIVALRYWSPPRAPGRLGAAGSFGLLASAAVVVVGMVWSALDWDIGCSILVAFAGLAASFSVAALVHSLRQQL